MTRSFEFFDHTADMGVSVVGDTLAELLCAAGEGLYEVIGRFEACSDLREVAFELPGNDLSLLLRDYLAELLVLFERERRIATGVKRAVFAENRLQATVQVAAIDDRRSAYYREVKAITYHELTLHQTAERYEATFIVDI
jgi:SHS2 domain-containing protein